MENRGILQVVVSRLIRLNGQIAAKDFQIVLRRPLKTAARSGFSALTRAADVFFFAALRLA